MQLNMKQVNNLCTGVKLATELRCEKDGCRRFLTIQGYSYDERGKIVALEKNLRPNVRNNIYFELRCYDLAMEYFVKNWDVTEEDLDNEVYYDDIKGIEALEKMLANYLQDYSVLKPEWDCDNLL